MKIKTIIWRDSNMYITQCGVDEKFKVSLITSCGFVVSENKEKIVLAGDVLDDGDLRRVIVIPKENIVRKR